MKTVVRATNAPTEKRCATPGAGANRNGSKRVKSFAPKADASPKALETVKQKKNAPFLRVRSAAVQRASLSCNFCSRFLNYQLTFSTRLRENFFAVFLHI